MAMIGKATFKSNISSYSLAMQVITIHTSKRKIICKIKWACLVLRNVDRNALEIISVQSKTDSLVRICLLHILKYFDTHFSIQWMYPALGRYQAPIGQAPIVDWVHLHWFQSNGLSLWNISSCITNAKSHMWR